MPNTTSTMRFLLPLSFLLTYVTAVEDDFSWLTCHDFLDHATAINKAAGVRDPRRVAGYSNKACRRVFEAAQKHGMVHNIVNLGSFFRENSIKGLSRDVQVPNVVPEMQARSFTGQDGVTRRNRELAELSASTCSFTYGQGNPGTGSAASGILPCPDPSLLGDICPHAPCINLDDNYLKVDSEDLEDDVIQTYEEFIPGYGGGQSYVDGVASINNMYWNGCERDRTDAGPVGSLLIATTAAAIAVLATDTICDAIEDDLEIPVICQDLPNPFKVGCEIAKAALKIILLGLETATAQADFQDGLVDGAEVEASYEHTKNLIDKQCAIFDQAVCRCAIQLGRGSGCDGVDSNCNNFIDECVEDIVPPEIEVDAAICLCSDLWFPTPEAAQACVTESVFIQDDCQQDTTTTFTTTDLCGVSSVSITAQDICTNPPSPDDLEPLPLPINEASASVAVKIDGTAPTARCSFEELSVVTSGPSLPTDVGFTYSASDECGGPVNVTVDVYASEIENFNAQEMALFFLPNPPLANDAAKLYLARAICSTVQNGQCIKDQTAIDARLYTAVVTVVDEAGNVGTGECELKVVPNGASKKKQVDTSNNFQRFFLTSYNSVFSDYSIP